MATAALLLWRVDLHAAVAALVLLPWLRRARIPPGPTRRRVLALLLLLPPLTALLRLLLEAGSAAPPVWLASERLLALPLGLGGARLAHAALVLALLAAAITLAQELLPLTRRRPGLEALPAEAEARLRPHLDRAGTGAGAGALDARLLPGHALVIEAGGRPSRPRLVVSQGALAALGDDELAAAVGHEAAHLAPRRYWAAHALWAARQLQPFNPVALWAFREYVLEGEIDCDRAACAAAGGPTPLARALLKAYARTERGDLSARATLRRRVDLLLEATAPAAPDRHAGTALASGLLLLLLLPWLS